VEGFSAYHGKKSNRMVVVDRVNLPVTRPFVEEIILESRKNRLSKVDILSIEFEMGLLPNVLGEDKGKGIDLTQNTFRLKSSTAGWSRRGRYLSPMSPT
jgi:hypothetical protein